MEYYIWNNLIIVEPLPDKNKHFTMKNTRDELITGRALNFKSGCVIFKKSTGLPIEYLGKSCFMVKVKHILVGFEIEDENTPELINRG
jgi:hypothetical protein